MLPSIGLSYYFRYHMLNQLKEAVSGVEWGHTNQIFTIILS